MKRVPPGQGPSDGRMAGITIVTMLLALAVAATGGLASAAVAATLPEGRVYERVSPAEKNAADVLSNPQRVRAAAGGDAAQFSSLTGFGDVRGTAVSTDYLALRDPATGAWKTHAITPQQQPTSLLELTAFGFEPRYVGDFSEDLAAGAFLGKALTAAPAVGGVVNLYRRADLRQPGAGAYELLTDAVAPQGGNAGNQPAIAGASADFSHVLIESTRNLTADAAGLDPAAPKLYMWASGTLRLAGILPAGECVGPPPCPAPASQAGQGALAQLHRYTPGTISRDGSRVIFTAPPFNASQSGGALYLRDDRGTPSPSDDATAHVSATERASQDPAGVKPATFWTASSDGAKVLFTTAEQLTDDDENATVDLYRYDLAAAVGVRLTRLSVDGELADNGGDPTDGHNVSGVLGASDDGAWVYFTLKQGQLVAGGPTGATGGPIGGQRIFRWHGGDGLREVGGVNGQDELNRLLGNPGWGVEPKWSRVSADGTGLAFVTEGTDELLALYGEASYDHGDGCPSLGNAACQEVYLYDATAAGGAGALRCASCDPTGAVASADADFFGVGSLSVSRDTSHLSHALSDDGQRVFFNTPKRLVAQDRNEVTDVYEYDATSGRVHLISGGSGTAPSLFMDASADGDDVYFTTRDQLVASDVDQSIDLYDARVGGVPDPGSLPEAVCEDDGCRPPPSPPRGAAAPPSAAFTGPPNLLTRAGPPPFFAVRPLAARQRRALARRGSAQIVVAASQRGVVTLRATARIGATDRTVGRARGVLRGPGQLRLRLALSAAARHRLADGRRLRVTLVVTCSGVPRAQRVHLTLGGRRR